MSSDFKQPFANLRKRSDLRKDFEKLTRLHELQLGHKMALSARTDKKTAKRGFQELSSFWKLTDDITKK